ncbi:MAG: hypothetical protein LBP53_02395 [Candidatus Peribacteria bacterium]|nr:hypothetical protein [Candidatus Peribacteria bacterium]
MTYYRGIYDEEASLGEKFSKVCDPVGALSLWKLESSRFSDVRIDYCGTSEIYRKDFFYNSEYNSKNPRTARWPAESHDQKTSVFEDTILANHDICMLAGVGGSFY